jgi:hypothetical protein
MRGETRKKTDFRIHNFSPLCSIYDKSKQYTMPQSIFLFLLYLEANKMKSTYDNMIYSWIYWKFVMYAHKNFFRDFCLSLSYEEFFSRLKKIFTAKFECFPQKKKPLKSVIFIFIFLPLPSLWLNYKLFAKILRYFCFSLKRRQQCAKAWKEICFKIF